MFPDPPHRNDEYVHFINDYLPMVLLVSFMLAVASICKDLVAEKEKKLKVTYTQYVPVHDVQPVDSVGQGHRSKFKITQGLRSFLSHRSESETEKKKPGTSLCRLAG